MNNLVPPDQLNWDEKTGSYGIISNKETDDLIEACFRTGLNRPEDILKVVREYEKIRAGKLLFDQFMAGNIGIYEFDDEDSPIFESVKEETIREIRFEAHEGPVETGGANHKSIGGRTVLCDCDARFDVFAFYRSVLDFCEKWNIEVMNGENPEEEMVMRSDPEFLREARRRSWRVSSLEKTEGVTKIAVRFTGNWLRTDHQDPS